MDPNSSAYAAYGYVDTGFAATGDTKDPGRNFGWSQWQPSAVEAQQQQQQQQHMQNFQHQAQGQLNSFGAFSGTQASYGQHQKPGYQQANQGAQKPGVRSGLGFSTVTGGVSFGGDWSQPPAQPFFGAPQQHKGTFPGKKSFGGNGGGQAMPKKFTKKTANKNDSKPFDPTGKSPAMLLHELFKDVSEEYVVTGTPPVFRCLLKANGQNFQMEASSKKAAKHKCSELVIRTLRPDIPVSPYQEPAAKASEPKKKKATNKPKVEFLKTGLPMTPEIQAIKRASIAAKRNATEMTEVEAPKPIVRVPRKLEAIEMTEGDGSKFIGKNAKKVKMSPFDSALSLIDYMLRLIEAKKTSDPTAIFNPTFDYTEREVVQVQAKVKQEPGVDIKPSVPKIEYTVVLKFEEQNKSYTKTGDNKNTIKDAVVREALHDLFGVTIQEIREVSRRAALRKINHNSSAVQALTQFCALMHCSVTLEAEPAENKPLGEGKMFYVGKCKVVDHTENDKSTFIVSPAMTSKGSAKDFAAEEMLRVYFEVDFKPISPSGEMTQGPCPVLSNMLNKGTKIKTPIIYEFKENVPAAPGDKETTFHCDCIVGDSKQRFSGTGRSKKLARQNAAAAALKKMFSIEYDPLTHDRLAQKDEDRYFGAEVSQLSKDIAHFAKNEYIGMCTFFNITPSNQLACFFLVNEKDEKRLISIGSSIQYVVEPDTLTGANGTSLIHLDPIVLARRALVRYFIQELTVLEKKPEEASVLEMVDGKAKLKSNLKVVLYSTFPPVCAYSCEDAAVKKLALVTPTTFCPCPDDVLSYEQIRAEKDVKIHCTADKIYKWSVLGVQGALLSQLMHPVFVDIIVFGSEAPVPNDSLKFALSGRMGEFGRELSLESIPARLRIVPGSCHSWTRGFDFVEQIDYNTGRTSKGSPSNICKSELFEAFRKLGSVDKKATTQYARAKQQAVEYQKAKAEFYEKMLKAGFGKWQRKPENFVDDFAPVSCDF